MRAEHTQVVIIGAGIGGCIAALALAKHYRVTLIDNQAQPPEKVGECLPPAARRILKLLEIESLLDKGPHLISQGMLSYWGSSQPTVMDNLRNPDGLGWHLDRPYFERQLRAQAQLQGVQCLWPAVLKGSKYHDNKWHLEIADNQNALLSANIVIDATGRHCVFARTQNVKRKQLDKLMSIWLTGQFNVTKNMALISSTDNGWWYSAPLPSRCNSTSESKGQSRVVSWQLNPEHIQKSKHQDCQWFLAQAKRVNGFGTLIEQLLPHSEQLYGIVAANTSRLEHFCGQQWFAIGDAAMSFDPLSSQGMFNAMASAMQLSDLLIENGLTSPLTAAQYQQQMDSVWAQYLHHKNMYYAQVS
ncbi:NAD(P)/FAD-dependent oxidoreductase [Pseudoalteromonas sp. S16_S37]|uniref:NAD(P)/FAD-dependent oxidoreductase n=1 Tax=Pseudoalteromonas sp. S16_S37 TaxID=2720228 RepID=UPI00168077FC|nr:tryptophan 7-halogenase [Pseudoalteromonas sp. S16_S37]MBD1582855.1 NAD(P)-binding protein [Pseudoalteromonas sp. S16_S37]